MQDKVPYILTTDSLDIAQLGKITGNRFTKEQLEKLRTDKTLMKSLGIDLEACSQSIQIKKGDSSNQFKDAEMEIPLAIGYNYLGKKYIADLAKLIHLVIAGPSGTGKSMALKCAIISMITRCSVEKLRLILLDIGGNSLTFFKDAVIMYM